MKFESYINLLLNFVYYNLNHVLFFLFNFFLKKLNNLLGLYFSLWKVANYSDVYWFLFSNKKTLYELKWM